MERRIESEGGAGGGTTGTRESVKRGRITWPWPSLLSYIISTPPVSSVSLPPLSSQSFPSQLSKLISLIFFVYQNVDSIPIIIIIKRVLLSIRI
jgi:hypothetical protein